MLQPLRGYPQEPVRDPQVHVQVVSPSIVSHEYGKSFLSVVVYHICNALWVIDPLAGALTLFQGHLTYALTFAISCADKAAVCPEVEHFQGGRGHKKRPYSRASVRCRWDTGNVQAHGSISRHVLVQGGLQLQHVHSAWISHHRSLGSRLCSGRNH